MPFAAFVCQPTNYSICGTDPFTRLTDAHLDNLLSYFEAIYWRKVDIANWHLQCPGNGLAAIFKSRGFWANRNQTNNTSRDRFVGRSMQEQANALEAELAELGYGFA